MIKKFLLTSACAIMLLSASAEAQVYVRIGPPPPRREVIVRRPSPRHVWVPGYYRWNGRSYYWTRGYWAVPPRPNAMWVPGRWDHRRGGYFFIEGHWR